MYNDATIIDQKYFEQRGNIYTIYEDRRLPVDCTFVQDKISKSNQGVIRGFHGDNKTWKLITCLHGKVKLVRRQKINGVFFLMIRIFFRSGIRDFVG